MISGCSTVAPLRGQRKSITSEKSIKARSDMPKVRSRLRSPMSTSMHSTRRPSAARQEATPAVREVLPVPPFPDVTMTAVPMERLLPMYSKS